jgi:putative exporter of polyketide antibiotics
MAKKKEPQIDGMLIALSAALMLFAAFHYIKLKEKYLATENSHRIFDMKALWLRLTNVGVGVLFVIWTCASLFGEHKLLFVLALPFGLYGLNLLAKALAYILVGVVIDHDTGTVHFPANLENLDILDYIKILPVVKAMIQLESIPISQIKKITRQAGVKLFLIGDFGSRRIQFSDKAMRDECIYWIQSYKNGEGLSVDNDLEFSE